MGHIFKQVITKIIDNIDGSKRVKSELQTDLLFKINEEYESYISQGFGEEEAEEKACEAFEDIDYISEQLQHEINPFQRKTLYALVLSSLLFTFLLYIGTLVIERQALMTWLIGSVLLNVVLLLFVFRVLKADEKWLINTVLIIHTIVNYIGLVLATSLDSLIVPMYVVYAILLMLISVGLLYLNILFHWDMSNRQKWFHIYNATTGIVIIGLNGFFFFLFSIFADHLFGAGLLVLIPFFIWIVIYIAQIQLLKKGLSKIAIGIATIPILLIIGMILFYIYL